MSSIDNYSNLQIDKGYSLSKMLENNNCVEIPIIQRDYAQGRKNATEIRNDFLKDLFDHLIRKEQMKLGFVYGATRKTSNGNVYIPYDGQQRLTLLYLSTLYLSAYSQEWNSFKFLSKFKYYTRDSATDFCAFLTKFDELDNDNETNNVFKRIDLYSAKNIREKIEDDISFFGTWIYDPTVESMLVVLQTIHDYFYKTYSKEDVTKRKTIAKELLDSLISGNIFFDWCSINASDGIYIKMNGRGKPLSAFDNFKNTLYVELNKLRKNDQNNHITERVAFLHNFEIKMDGIWTDLFWKYRDSLAGKTCFDISPFMMNFLFFAFELRYTIKTKSFFFGGRTPFCWIDEKNSISFLKKFSESCKVTDSGESIIDLDDFIWVSKLMDILCYRLNNDSIDINLYGVKDYDNEISLWKSVSSKNDFKNTDTGYLLPPQTSIISAFYYEYLINSHSFDNNGNCIGNDDICRNQWLKLIGRLSNTIGHYKSRFDDLQRYKHVFTGYENIFVKTVFEKSKTGNMIEASDEIKNKLKELKGYFDSSHAYNQLFEEVEKLSLIKFDKEKWENRIEDAEEHLAYFDNQIYFLFELSRDSDGKISETKFDKYKEIICNLTDSNGIIDTFQNQFTALLLSFGDYRIGSGEGYANARGLCSNKSAEFFKWRNFFDILDGNKNKTSVLKQTLDLLIIYGNLDSAYLEISKNKTPDNWRNIIISYPEVLAHGSGNRIIHKDDIDDSWYLIKSPLTKQVHRTSFLESLNLELYGIYRDCGFDDKKYIGQGKKLSFDNGFILEKTEKNMFCLKDKSGMELGNGNYEEIVNYIDDNKSLFLE